MPKTLDKSKSAVTNILRYGEWSGPGWTAGGSSNGHAAAGVARILTAAERAREGRDRYDNYVARIHDLNEFDAETALRRTLGGMGLISEEVEDRPGLGPVHAERFDRAGGRFVEGGRYRRRLQDKGLGATEARRLELAFLRYLQHVARSNVQFAFDHKMMTPQLNFSSFSAFFGTFKMIGENFAGPHVFSAEIAPLMKRDAAIRDRLGMRPAEIRADLAAYLKDAFLTPDMAEFRSSRLGAAEPVVARATLIGAPVEKLRLMAAEWMSWREHPRIAKRSLSLQFAALDRAAGTAV